MLLSSLKEVIARHALSDAAAGAFRCYVDSVTPILVSNAERQDEGVRSMVAECLGRLAIVDR